MSEKKRKSLYWSFKALSVIVSCAFPIWAILERYPLWIVSHGKSQSIGAGGILTAVVLFVIFRKSVFKFLRDRCKIQHAPPIVIWVVMIAISYAMMFVSKFLADITPIFWMGLIGCAIGTLLTAIAENRFGRKKVEPHE